MAILTASDLSKRYGAEPILRGVTFSVEPEEKVALIGRNGSGKTTLLRLLAGLDEPDAGSVSHARWAKIGYLAQIPTGPGDADVFAHALSGAADVRALEARLRELEAQMARPDVHDNPHRLAEVMAEYAQVRHHFEHAGGFTLEARARTVLGGLGFSEEGMTQTLGTLSGGWRVRAELARVLLAEPDLLLLDEPTNHLDLAATEWLEEYLGAFPGAAVIVSHDRRLLDAVTSRTLDLDAGAVTSFPGSYSAYATMKTQQIQHQAEAYRRHQEEVEKLEAYIRRYRAGNRATQAKSREKRLARLTSTPVQPPRAQPVMRPAARTASQSGRMVVRLQEVAKQYDQRAVLSGIDLEIYRGDRVGVRYGRESQRLSLLKLLLHQPNLLLLDEPTNHLDIPSREALEAALMEFPGTFVIATHDRYLLERLATRVLTVEDGRVADFRGTYDDFKAKRRRPVGQPSPQRRGSVPAPREARPARSVKTRVVTFEELAVQITAAEQELADAGRLLADPELYR